MNYRYGARPNVYMWFYQVSQKKNYHSYYNCSCTQQSCCKTPWALGTQWVHRPWATSNSIDLPVSVAVGGVQKLLVTFTLRWRTAAPDPSTTAWLSPMSLGSKIDQLLRVSSRINGMLERSQNDMYINGQLSIRHTYECESDVFGFDNRSATRSGSISGATALRRPRHQPQAPRPTLLSCAREAAMCSIEPVCCAT